MYNIENMLMADHLDKYHVLCQQNPFANSNVAAVKEGISSRL